MKYMLLLMTFAYMAPVPSASQAVLVLAQNETPQRSMPAAPKIDINFQQMLLRDAVREIVAQSKLSVMYSTLQLPADHRVTYVAKKVTGEEALAAVLRGTSIAIVPMNDGTLRLQPSARSSQKAQVNGVITGKIIHAKTKQPVAGATVLLDDATQGVTVGADGTFRITAPSGERTLRVRAVGFVRQVKKVVVSDEASVAVEIVMEPSASVLDEVIVTGTIIATERRAIANPITVITAEEIERRGITRIDQLLRGEVPGVIALEKGTAAYEAGSPGLTTESVIRTGEMVSSNLFTRGASTFDRADGDAVAASAPLKTFVDGVEIMDASYLGMIDPQSIERVEIITGPQAATVYGSGAMGGVMQIFTKKGFGGKAPELSLRLRYGMLQNSVSNGLTPSHHHAIGVTGSTGPRFSYSANSSYVYQGQWQPNLFNRSISGSLGVTQQIESLTISGSMSVTTGQNGAAYLYNPVTWRDKFEAGEWRAVNTARYHDRRISKSSGQTFALNANHQITSMIQQYLTIGRSQTHFENVPPRPSLATPNDSLYARTGRSGVRNSLSYNASVVVQPHHAVSSTMTAGVNGTWATTTTLGGCLASRSSVGYIPCGASEFEGVNVYERSYDSRGGFASWRLGLFDRLYVMLGVRGELNDAYGREHRIDWTPTNGLSYVIEYGDVTAKLVGSYGRATRAPLVQQREEIISPSDPSYTPAQYVTQRRNDELRPERSRGPQGGVEVYVGSRGSFSLNRYRQVVTDLLQSVSVDTLYRERSTGSQVRFFTNQYQNVGEIVQHGWEATGTLQVAFATLKGTYSWNDSRVKKSLSSAWQPGVAFAGIPTHTGHIQAHIAYGATSITSVVNYVGAMGSNFSNSIVSYEVNYSRIGNYVDRAKGFNGMRTRAGYVKSDLIISHRAKSWLSAEVNITNLGNSHRSDSWDYWPSLGRQTLLGLSLRYPKS